MPKSPQRFPLTTPQVPSGLATVPSRAWAPPQVLLQGRKRLPTALWSRCHSRKDSSCSAVRSGRNSERGYRTPRLTSASTSHCLRVTLSSLYPSTLLGERTLFRSSKRCPRHPRPAYCFVPHPASRPLCVAVKLSFSYILVSYSAFCYLLSYLLFMYGLVK